MKPQLLQVLYATDMPGVLTEIGFMTNSQEMAYMKSEKGQQEIARNIYQGIRDYSDYVLRTRRAGGGRSGPDGAGAAGGGFGRRFRDGCEGGGRIGRRLRVETLRKRCRCGFRSRDESGCEGWRDEAGRDEAGRGASCFGTPALYDSGAGQREAAAGAFVAVPLLPREGEAVHLRRSVPPINTAWGSMTTGPLPSGGCARCGGFFPMPSWWAAGVRGS